VMLLAAVVLVAISAAAFAIFRHSSQPRTPSGSNSRSFVLDQGKGDGDRVYTLEPCDKLGSAKLDPTELARARAAYQSVGFSTAYFDAHFKYRETANSQDIFQICAGQGAAVTSWGNNHAPSISWAMQKYRNARAHDYANLIPISQALTDLNNCAAAAKVAPNGGMASVQLDAGKEGNDQRIEPYLTGEGYINHGQYMSTVYDFWINLEDGSCSTTKSGAAF